MRVHRQAAGAIAYVLLKLAGRGEALAVMYDLLACSSVAH